MRKIHYPIFGFFFFSVLIFLYSCQREIDANLLSKPPVSSKDPAKLSASLKVWHGTRTIGTAPTPTGNIPEINPTANPTILSIAGRYAIIKPEVTAGDVAGYYLGIPGAGQYFKVDFSKPRNITGRSIRPKHSDNTFQRTTSGNADSSIVIVLPPNINVPDTFCVTYCPYDSLGNIGQPVTTCIYVSSLGTPASEGWLQNDFKITSSWDDSSGYRTNIDSIIFNKWTTYSEVGYGYYCDQSQTPPVLMYGPTGGPAIISDSIFYLRYNIRFATNGAFDFKDIEQEKNLDVQNSTCNQFTFSPTTNYTDTITGAYTYNPVTQKIILIFEFDSSGIPDPEYWEYDVFKLTDNHFILRDPIDNYFIRFER